MKPRYEIHSIGMPEIVNTGAGMAHGTARPRALFAATEMVNTNRFETEFGQDRAADQIRGVCQALPDAVPGARCSNWRRPSPARTRRTAALTTSSTSRRDGDAASPEMRDAWGTGPARDAARRMARTSTTASPARVRTSGSAPATIWLAYLERRTAGDGRAALRVPPPSISGWNMIAGRSTASRRSRDRCGTRVVRRCRAPPSWRAKSRPARPALRDHRRRRTIQTWRRFRVGDYDGSGIGAWVHRRFARTYS